MKVFSELGDERLSVVARRVFQKGCDVDDGKRRHVQRLWGLVTAMRWCRRDSYGVARGVPSGMRISWPAKITSGSAIVNGFAVAMIPKADASP